MLLRSLLPLVLICFVSWPSFGQNRGIDYADFDEAHPLALAGNVDAQYRIGWLYQYGEGVKQNYEEALKWLSLAAESGHEAAQNDRNELRFKIKTMGQYKLKGKKEKILNNCPTNGSSTTNGAPVETNIENLRGKILDRNGRVLAGCSPRFYPGSNLASHVIGHTNTRNVGLAGIEKSMNSDLAAGENVVLSIDIDLQKIVHEELQEGIKKFEAIGGAGIVLDMETGEILSSVSLPDFDLNLAESASRDEQFNRVTKGLYEFGSVFKVFNTAIALDSGAVNINQRFDVSKSVRVSRFNITDYHPHEEPLNVPEILVYSSNIGSARIAQSFGAKTQMRYMKKLGLLDRLPLEIPETSQPLKPKLWGQTTLVTLSYGHGLSVSLAHLASAVSAASGNGQWTQPSFIKRNYGDEPLRRKVFSAATTRSVRSMMRQVVSHPDGTGNFADARGYMVGGKTGTAEKFFEGNYDKKANLATFAAVFPVHNPKYVVVVMVDEPKGQNHSHGYATAGWVAAPVIRRIIERIAPILRVLAVEESSTLVKRHLDTSFAIGGGALDESLEAHSLEERSVKENKKTIESEAYFLMGQRHHYGKAVPVDYKKAITNYKLALQLSEHSGALYELGLMSRLGLGFEVNFSEAADYFHRAIRVDENFNLANFQLANLYFKGLGIEKDISKALELYKSAATQNHPRAALKLEEIYNYGINVEPDPEQAKFWLELAAKMMPAEDVSQVAGGLIDGVQMAKEMLSGYEFSEYRTKTKSFSGRFVALMIGVEKYERLQDLLTPVNDVKEIGDVLAKRYGFDVKTLKNPDRATITLVLNELAAELEPEDTLLIYYAGHGKEVSGDGFWLPADADKDVDTNWIPNDYITRKLKNIRSTNILVVSDSCFSGTLSRGVVINSDQQKEQPEDVIDLYTKTKSRVLITSGNLEPVMDGGGGKHSVFARTILEHLTANRSIMTATELYNRTSKLVVTESMALGDPQSPVLAALNNAGHIGPDFVFVPQ